MVKRKTIGIICMCLITCALAAVSQASNWSSYQSAEISGIDVKQSGNSFTITLGNNALINGMQITEIQSFCILSAMDNTYFAATGSDIPITGKKNNSWTFDGGNSVNIAGWTNNSNNGRITQNSSMNFTFDTLDISNTPTVLGFHVGYITPSGDTTTGFFKTTSVPELPASTLSIILLLTPLGSKFLKRKQNKKVL